MSSAISADIIRELLKQNRDEIISAIAEMVKGSASASAAIKEAMNTKKSRKSSAKASSEGEAEEPKVKRAPNSWILFTMRIENLIRKYEAVHGISEAEQMKTTVVKQFCSNLKEKKTYDEWVDKDIIKEFCAWTPPDVSKQSVTGKSKRSKAGDISETASVISEPATAPAVKPEPKKSNKKKAEAVAPPPAPADEPMKFYMWTHEGVDYWKNSAGYIISTDMEWVGKWDGKNIDENFPQPDDLDSATFDE
jgi:hypothetical protein